MIAVALRASARIDEIMHDHVKDFKFPGVISDEWRSCVQTYLTMQTALARHYNNLGYLLFNVTIKSHCTEHIADDARHLNPQRGWDYAGEHFMAIVKTVASSSTRGNKAHQVSKKIIGKYRQGMQMEMLSAAA